MVRALGTCPFDVWALRFGIAALTMGVLIAPCHIKSPNPSLSLNLVVSATLLAAPYARNYDYVLLIPPLLAIWHASGEHSGTSQVRISCVLIFLATAIMGIYPYFASREAHGSVVWISALISYWATLFEIWGAKGEDR